MGKPTDLYGILGVPATADTARIRAAYRRLAWIHHPDVGGSSRRMMTLNEAWRVLRDPHERARYDAWRTAAGMAAATTTATASTDPACGAAPSVAASGAAATATAAAASGAGRPVPPPRGAPMATGPAAASTPPPHGPTVMGFGRYAGWSLAQLALHDPDYLEWLARTPIGRDGPGRLPQAGGL